jgi:hypothetical protein
MKKLVGLCGLLALFIMPVAAQETPAPPEDQTPTAPTAPTEPVKVKHTYPTPKAEISLGFTYRGFYGPSGTNISMNGAFASYDYNFFRWLGVEGEVLGVTGTLKIPNLPAEDIDIFTAMVGPKLYPLGHHKLTPFGHFLYGAGINTTSVPAFSGYGGNTSAVYVRAWQAGGGLDYNRWTHWGIRLIQFDYGSAKFLGSGVQGQGSKRFSFGFVYRFGEK